MIALKIKRTFTDKFPNKSKEYQFIYILLYFYKRYYSFLRLFCINTYMRQLLQGNSL